MVLKKKKETSYTHKIWFKDIHNPLNANLRRFALYRGKRDHYHKKISGQHATNKFQKKKRKDDG